MANEVVFEVRSLTKRYPLRTGMQLRGDRPSVAALDGVSLRLRSNITTALVGESGCGKSTLAKVMSGLEPPTDGSVQYRGHEVHELRGTARRRFHRAVQLVLQDPYSSLDPRMSVGRTVEEPMTVHRIGSAGTDRRERVKGVLESVGLPASYLTRYPHQLSGGQRQRVSIARALALEPEVIVWDEPVSALDLSVQAQLLNLLAELSASRPQSYLFISHDLGVVEHVADEVMVMYLGKVVEHGPTSEVFTRPAHPYTVALLSAAPPPPGEPRRERIILRGELPSPEHPAGAGCPFRSRCWMAEDVCAEQAPPLADVTSGHAAACHFAPAFERRPPQKGNPPS